MAEGSVIRALALSQRSPPLSRKGGSERSNGTVPKNVALYGGPRVRIPVPPAESPSLAGAYLRGSRTPAFRAGVPGCVPGAVGREPHGPPTSHQPAAISLSGHIPVPHFWRCDRDKLSG